MQTQAHRLWQESQSYIATARQHLNPRLLRPKNLVATHDEEEWLRIAFLFPTLPEKSKTDLLIVRRFFLMARDQQERERLDPHDTAEYSEAMAEQVAAQLREALPSFSSVQREILDIHYLMRSEGQT